MYSLEWVRDGMMALWKSTFHDDDQYIELVFDKYFDYGYFEYEVRGDMIVSALLGVPYRFGGRDFDSCAEGHDDNAEECIRGLYLCGLATSPEYRRQGIMGSMLRRMETKARNDGFSFVFLIPADEGLRRYYGDRGYFDASYRIPRRYTGMHDFLAEYTNETSADAHDLSMVKTTVINHGNYDTFMTGNRRSGMMKNIYNALHDFERNRSGISILHAKEDFESIIKDNIMSGGSVIIAYSCDADGDNSADKLYDLPDSIHNNIRLSNGKYNDKIKTGSCAEKGYEVKGLLFISYLNNDSAAVVDMMCDSKAIYYSLMSAVSRCASGREIIIYRNSIEKNRESIWSPYYIRRGMRDTGIAKEGTGIFDEAKLAEPYTMMKILNLREILKFADMSADEPKYSVVVKTDSKESETVPDDNGAGRSTVYLKYTVVTKCDDSKCGGDIGKYDLKPKLDIRVDVVSCPSPEEKGEALTEQEVGRLLFRRSAGGVDSLKELLGLPSIRFVATLLLD